MKRASAVITGLVFVFFTVICGIGFAENVNDGFESARQAQSRFFNIFIEDGVDMQSVASRIAVPSSIAAIVKEPLAFSSDTSSFSDQIDLLFLAVCEIMDTRLKKFTCNIKICRDASKLEKVTDKLFGRPMKTPGFYVVAIDTLYIDADNININVLGHELSHAVQTHYFVVPPPVVIQEVLAGYVEFQLRKYTHSLPRK